MRTVVSARAAPPGSRLAAVNRVASRVRRRLGVVLWVLICFSLQTRWRIRFIAEPDRERRRRASGCPVIRGNKAKQSKKRTINNCLELNYAGMLNSENE